MSTARKAYSTRTKLSLLLHFLVIFGVIAVIALIVSAPKKAVFDNMDPPFFTNLLRHRPQDEIKIASLDAYYLDNWYYYHVVYSCFDSASDSWDAKDQVYFGRIHINDHEYFDLNKTPQGSKSERELAYEAALLHGEHKSFSQKEIEGHTTYFYNLAADATDSLKKWQEYMIEFLK